MELSVPVHKSLTNQIAILLYTAVGQMEHAQTLTVQHHQLGHHALQQVIVLGLIIPASNLQNALTIPPHQIHHVQLMVWGVVQQQL